MSLLSSFVGLSSGGVRSFPPDVAASWVSSGAAALAPAALAALAPSAPAAPAAAPPAPAALPSGLRVLRGFGAPAAPFAVVFSFRWGRGWACVVSRVASRSAAARLLRRLRSARRAVLALRLPVSVVWGSRFPRFCLRWLACRRCRVGVFSASGLVGRAFFVRSAPSFALPPAPSSAPSPASAAVLFGAPASSAPAPAPAASCPWASFCAARGWSCPSSAAELVACRALSSGLCAGFGFLGSGAALAGGAPAPFLAAARAGSPLPVLLGL